MSIFPINNIDSVLIKFFQDDDILTFQQINKYYIDRTKKQRDVLLKKFQHKIFLEGQLNQCYDDGYYYYGDSEIDMYTMYGSYEEMPKTLNDVFEIVNNPDLVKQWIDILKFNVITLQTSGNQGAAYFYVYEKLDSVPNNVYKVTPKSRFDSMDFMCWHQFFIIRDEHDLGNSKLICYKRCSRNDCESDSDVE